MVELVTKNYTDVIFDLAQEENHVEQIGEELGSIAEIMAANPEYLTMLTSPQIPKNEKIDSLNQVFGGKITETSLNFMKVLIENRRAAYLLAIAESYKVSQRKFLGIEYVEALTAVPMDEDQKEKLIRTLETKLGKKIELNNIVDSDIIGGMKIKIGEKALDGSLSNRLKALQSEISK